MNGGKKIRGDNNTTDLNDVMGSGRNRTSAAKAVKAGTAPAIPPVEVAPPVPPRQVIPPPPEADVPVPPRNPIKNPIPGAIPPETYAAPEHHPVIKVPEIQPTVESPALEVQTEEEVPAIVAKPIQDAELKPQIAPPIPTPEPQKKSTGPVIVGNEENIILETSEPDILITQSTTSTGDSLVENPPEEYGESEDQIDENTDVSLVNKAEASTSVDSGFDISSPLKIGSSSTGKTARAFSDFNPGKNIRVENDQDYQLRVLQQYVYDKGSIGNIVNGPRSVTKVCLGYSGIFIDVSSYTNAEMLSIHRRSGDTNLVEKIEMELHSAFEHTVNTSLKTKLDFVEWCKAIKYPDVWSIYWGIYNVNHPGINAYEAICDNYQCRERISSKRDNYDISFVTDFSRDDITNKVIEDIRANKQRGLISSFAYSDMLIEREEYLTDSKIKIFYGMPSVHDMLTFLKLMKTEFNETDEMIKHVFQPLSWIHYEDDMDKVTTNKIIAYKLNLYTRKVLAPVSDIKDVDGAKIAEITYVDVDPAIIPVIINNLSRNDFKEFASSKKVKEMIRKEGIHFRVKNIVCPKCKTPQLDIALDMRDVLFMRAAISTDYLTSM